MRRTASEILSDLELRVAHLERKQMNFDYGYGLLPSRSTILSDRELEKRGKSHFKTFKKGLTKLLVALDDIANSEYAIEDLGLGDGFLSRVERKHQHYYSKAVQKLLSSTGLPQEEATLENYLRGYNTILSRLTYPESSMGGLIAFALKEIFRRAFIEDDNKEAIFGIASDLLGFEVKPQSY